MQHVEALERRQLLAASFPSSATELRVVLGHDGYPDPDDIAAKIPGYALALANSKSDSRVELLGITTGDVKNTGGGGDWRDAYRGIGPNGQPYATGGDGLYAKDRNVVAEILRRSAGSFVHRDAAANFNTAANWLKDKIVAAVNAGQPLVYSAGGAVDLPDAAVTRARSAGVTTAQLDRYFRIVQHSNFNLVNASTPAAFNRMKPYIIGIEDQNSYEGQADLKGFNEDAIGLNNTGTAGFLRNLIGSGTKRVRIVNGQAQNASENRNVPDDISDAGSHDFASQWNLVRNAWANTGWSNNNTDNNSRINHETPRSKWVNAVNALGGASQTAALTAEAPAPAAAARLAGLSYTGSHTWNASTGTLTFTSSGTLNGGNKNWRVPAGVKRINIGAPGGSVFVRVTGSFDIDHNLTIDGNGAAKSELFGTNVQDWSGKNAIEHSAIHLVANATVYVSDLTSRNPRGFNIRGAGENRVVRADRVRLVDDRGGYHNNSDGFVGGSGSWVRDSFISTLDDGIKLYYDNIDVRNVTIEHLYNGAPIQLGWNNEQNNTNTITNLTVIGKSTSKRYNQAVISWRANSAPGQTNTRDLTVNGLTLRDEDGGDATDKDFRLFMLLPPEDVANVTINNASGMSSVDPGEIRTRGTVRVNGEVWVSAIASRSTTQGVFSDAKVRFGDVGITLNDPTPGDDLLAL